VQGSNLRLLACRASTLPTELTPRASGRIRTCDLQFRKLLLSPLSYRRIMLQTCTFCFGFQSVADHLSSSRRWSACLRAPGGIRTPDLAGRNRLLYSTELQARSGEGRFRSADLLVMSQTLSQLSYLTLLGREQKFCSLPRCCLFHALLYASR